MDGQYLVEQLKELERVLALRAPFEFRQGDEAASKKTFSDLIVIQDAIEIVKAEMA